MSKMGDRFTEEKAKEYEDQGVTRSEELADLLTITEMTNIIWALTEVLDNESPLNPYILEIRSVIWEARSIAERNEYAGDYDYPEEES